MKGALRLAALVALALFAPGVEAGDLAAEIHLMLGQKQLDSDSWSPVEDQLAVVVETSWGRIGWPVQIAADLGLSTDDTTIQGVKLEGETLELSLGVRRSFLEGRFRPYAGGGAAWISAEAKASGFGVGASADDSSAGFWLGGGALWRLGRNFRLGLAARFSDAEVTIAGVDGDAGGLQAGFVCGWSWQGTDARPVERALEGKSP